MNQEVEEEEQEEQEKEEIGTGGRRSAGGRRGTGGGEGGCVSGLVLTPAYLILPRDTLELLPA